MRQIGYNLGQDIMGVFTVGLQPMVLIRNTNENCLEEKEKTTCGNLDEIM